MIDYAGLADLDVLVEKRRELAMDLQVLEGVIARLRMERARKAAAAQESPIAFGRREGA
jgi:hypothetical protein